jgi:hypothetical protein
METTTEFNLPDEVEEALNRWFKGVQWKVINSWRNEDTYYITVHDDRGSQGWLNFLRIFKLTGGNMPDDYHISIDNQWVVVS